MLKEAIEKIEELAKPEIFTEACGRSYVVGKDGETREIIRRRSIRIAWR